MPKNLKYPNLAIFFSIVFMTYLFLRIGVLQNFVGRLGDFGYLGAFVSGMFFVSTFTVVPAAAVLALFAAKLNIFTLSLIAGLGGMAGDYLIFRFIKDGLVGELKDIFKKVAGENTLKFHWIIHTRYFGWLWPVIGAIIIASPFPDELGIGMLSAYKLEDKKFLIISFLLDTVGIFIILSAIKALA